MFCKKQLLIILSITAYATTHCYTSDHTQFAAQQFISATDFKPAAASEAFEINFQWLKDFMSGSKNLEFKEPAEFEQLSTLFRKNENYARTEERITKKDFKDFIKKMNLVCGEGNRKDHLLSYLFNVDELSMPACERAVALITQPTDEKTATCRGAIIKAMADNPQLINELRSYFSPVKKGSASLLYFEQQPDKLIIQLQKQLYWNLLNFTGLNDSVEGLEFGVRLNNANLAFCLIAIPGTLINTFAKLEQSSHPNLTYMEAVRRVPGIFARMFHQAPALSLFCGGLFGAYQTMINAGTVYVAKLQRDLMNLMQTQLINIADYINGMKKLHTLANKSAVIKQNWEGLKHLESLVTPSSEHTDKFNRLLKLLSTDTFKGEASFFSVSGRVLAAYQLLSDELVRKEFNDAVNAFAEFEVYAAIADTVHKARDKQTTYCFVNFVNNDKPYIHAVDFWNPFVNQDKAVTNTVELGGDTSTRNIILTGPNTGGKSTFSKAIIYNTLLAQTFGIAPARQFTLTPFAILNCYLNITDDTAAGLSGLKAQVERAKDLIESVKHLKDNEFAIIIIDEIFTGTTPEQAEELAYKFIKGMTECKNCMFINPTHYSSLIRLGDEKNSPSKNYHMEVITDNQGKVAQYTYKLAEGPSYVHNAEQVAQESQALW